LPREYGFTKRSRRPAEDIFNASINYFYGMMYGKVEQAILAAGLDPQMGILHVDAYKKPTLAFDLIEAFRPWCDRLLMEQCISRQLLPAFFTKNQHGIFLNKKGKAHLIPLFNDYLREEVTFFGRSATRNNHIFYLAGQLAQRIKSR
jgi:CRISPR-associated protein Cas1